jgi:hypothetical protein
MKRLTLIAALAAGPAFAENVTVYVVQPDNDGVVQRESNTTVEEAAVMIDGERPFDATGVVLEKGQRVKWTTLSAQEINEYHGGEGEPYIENLDEDDVRRNQSGDDMEFDEDEGLQVTEDEDESDIDFEGTKGLFPRADNMNATRIQPRDGNWIIEIMEQTFTGCPAMVEDAARAQMAAMNMSGSSGNYGPDFTPEQMAPQLDWTQIGTNTWFGILDMLNDQGGVYLQWGVQVISPTVIENRQELTFFVPGLGSCEVFTFVLAAQVN